jgi:hypothetical protein
MCFALSRVDERAQLVEDLLVCLLAESVSKVGEEAVTRGLSAEYAGSGYLVVDTQS